MAEVKIFGKENGVAILLASGQYIYGDPDGDFVAQNGTASDQVSVKRTVNDFFVVNDLVHTDFKDKDGNAIAATRDAVVTALNNNFFNRGSSLFEIGDVEDPGSGSLSKTTPDKKLQLKVKSDGSGFELVNKPLVVADIGGSALEFGSGDNQVLAWSLSKQVEDGSTANLYRAAIRPSINVQADVSYETYNGDSYRTTALTVRDIEASLTLKSGGVINSEAKDIILNPADTYVTSITRLKTFGDTIIGGDIKTASGTNDDIVIDCDGTGRVRFKSEIMPHADQDLVIHSGGVGNMIVKPNLQIDGEIVTGSNNDLILNPGGTGAIILQADDIRFEQTTALTGAEIRLNEFSGIGDNYVALRAPITLSADVAFTLPTADGTNGQVLKTDGSGALSFVDTLSDTSATLKGTTSLKPVGGLDASLAFFDDDGSNAISLRAPDSLSANTTFRLPAADGTNGQVIKTDGSGNLAFVDQTADTNTQLTTEQVQDIVGAMFTGNTETRISATYEDGDGTIDLVVDDMTADTNTSLADTDQTLTGARIVNMNGNDLNFKDGGASKLLYDDSEDEWIFKTDVRFDGGSAGGFIKLRESSSAGTEGVILRCPTGDLTSDVTLRLPNSVGAAGQFMKTDGSGNLSFATPTDTSLSDTDQTLTGGRTINVNQNDLFIKDGSNIKLQFDSSEDEFLFTSPVRFDGGNAGGFIKLRETVMGGTDGVILRAPSGAMSGDVEFRLPNADGSAGQFIKTDGSGNLSFGSAGSSSTIKWFIAGGAQVAFPFARYLPLTGDVIEQNTASSALSRTGFVAPYDGEVKKVMFRSQETLGNTELRWYKATDGTHGPATSLQTVTIDYDTADKTETYTYSTVTFSKGDVLSLRWDPTSDPVSSTCELNYTVEFEFDTST